MIKKLRSNRGASLTLSLLLLLICTTIGTVVLVAGTAAAGRMSRQSQADQSYYSVSSAAQLLIQEIESDTVAIQRSKLYSVQEYSVYKQVVQEDGTVTTELDDTYTEYSTQFSTDINGRVESTELNVSRTPNSFDPPPAGIPTTDLGLLTQAATYLVFGEDMTCNNDAAMARRFGDLPRDIDLTADGFTMTHTVAGEAVDADSLAVTVTPILTSNGTLKLTIQDSAKYRLTLTFSPKHAGGVPQRSGDVTTITDTVTWELESIAKGG